MSLESELETIRTNIVINLTSKGVTASNTESLNDLVGKVNTVKTPINSSLVLKETYQNDISGVVDCLRDKFRINLSKQGVETLSTDGLTTLSNSISLIKFDTVLTLTSDKSSASTGETVTLTATLVDVNGNPVNGATVVFMEGNTTLYSGITNNLGVLTYSYSSSTTGSKTLQCKFTGNTNYLSSNSSVVSLSICLFVDDGVTGNKNTNYLYVNGCLNEITDAGTRVYTNTYADSFCIPNIDLNNNFTIEWVLIDGNAYYPAISILDTSNNILFTIEYYSNSRGWFSTPNFTAPLPNFGDTYKLVRNGSNYYFYQNNTQIYSITLSESTVRFGFKTHTSDNRWQRFKDLKIY